MSQTIKSYQETPEEREFELRGSLGAYWTGGRLLMGMFAFFFASLAFAYFYLRSNNSGHLWRPHGITAPTSIGWAIFFVVVLSAFFAYYGQYKLRSGSMLDWRVSNWLATFGALAAVGLQVWQLTDLPFYPGSSGYASCFIGWAVMNIMLLLGGFYWLETNGAREIRLRKLLGAQDSIATSTTADAQVFRANLQSATAFWGFIAVISGLFWLFMYLI